MFQSTGSIMNISNIIPIAPKTNMWLYLIADFMLTIYLLGVILPTDFTDHCDRKMRYITGMQHTNLLVEILSSETDLYLYQYKNIRYYIDEVTCPVSKELLTMSLWVTTSTFIVRISYIFSLRYENYITG